MNNKILAAPCGLYCGVCADYVVSKECHGCGCSCGECAGSWHYSHCTISKCVQKKNLKSCVDCPEMPCTELIQFAHDPVWTTHSACIDNLKRRKKIGTTAWIKEQKDYYSRRGNLEKEIARHGKCAKIWNEKQKDK